MMQQVAAWLRTNRDCRLSADRDVSTVKSSWYKYNSGAQRLKIGKIHFWETGARPSRRSCAAINTGLYRTYALAYNVHDALIVRHLGLRSSRADHLTHAMSFLNLLPETP